MTQVFGGLRPHFIYRARLVDRAGNVISDETVKNLVPTEGLDAMQNILFNGAAAPSAWYAGLYSGNYTPTADVTAATIVSAATEFTGYASPTRVQFQPTASAGGIVAGAADIEFDFTSSASIYGGFIGTSSTKNSNTGALWSVVRFPSPKPATDELKLLVSVGFVLFS